MPRSSAWRWTLLWLSASLACLLWLSASLACLRGGAAIYRRGIAVGVVLVIAGLIYGLFEGGTMNLLKRIDRWIGRHMSAKRWIVVYSGILIGGGVPAWRGGWWVFLGAPMVIVGVLGIVGHARRL